VSVALCSVLAEVFTEASFNIHNNTVRVIKLKFDAKKQELKMKIEHLMNDWRLITYSPETNNNPQCFVLVVCGSKMFNQKCHYKTHEIIIFTAVIEVKTPNLKYLMRCNPNHHNQKCKTLL
jgi:hypothetical protein